MIPQGLGDLVWQSSQARSRYGCSVAVLRRQRTPPKYRRLAHMPEEDCTNLPIEEMES